MDKDMVIHCRKGLVLELDRYSISRLAKIKPMKMEYIEELLFNTDIDIEGNIVKHFALPLELMKRINHEDISFDNFDARGFDFTEFSGIKLNPQTVYKKDLSYAKLNGVVISRTFDGVLTEGTDFTGYISHIDMVRRKK